MLSEQGKLPPFSYIRHKVRRNPIVPLPENARDILDKVTHCLVTHSQKFGLRLLQHTDHLDAAGESFLKQKSIPVVCPAQDAPYLKKLGLQVEVMPDYWQPESFLNGEITAVPAQHGHTWVHYFMANGAGFFLKLPDEPSIYISGDTVNTADVERALTRLKPDVAVAAAGQACLDISKPILMTMDEILTFVRTAPKKVIVNHLEALNHCSITRAQLKQELDKQGLLSKVFIPDDGETIVIEG